MDKDTDSVSIEHGPRAFSDDDPMDNNKEEKNVIKHLPKVPMDFMKTKCYMNALNKFREALVTELHGAIGMGKGYILNMILNEEASSKSIIWSTSPISTLHDLVKEFKTAAELILQEMKLEINFDSVKVEKIGAHLMEELIARNVSCAFGITLLPDCEKAALSFLNHMIREVLDSSKYSNTPEVRILLSTSTKGELYKEDEIRNMNGQFRQVEISGFNHDNEAIKYLSNEVNHAPDLRQRKEDNEKVQIALHFDNNPACLKGVKLYCNTKDIPFKSYLRLINSQSTQKDVHKETLDLLTNLHSGNAEAYKVINDVEQGKCPISHENVANTLLNVWKLLYHEDLPISVVSQIFHFSREDTGNFSQEENATLNLKMAYDALTTLRKTHNVKIVSLAAPNSTVTIPKNKFDAITMEDKERNQDIALKAITSLLDKDDRQANANLILFQLTPHMDALSKTLKRATENDFNMKKSSNANFQLYMKVCRLNELLGQALVLGQDKSKWVKALHVLFNAAEIIWEGVCSFEKIGSFLACFTGQSVDRDALKYDGTENPQESAKKIVKHCIAAGEKLLKNSQNDVENYMLHTLKINQSNLDDFIFNCIKGGESEEIAEEMLKEVKTAVESKLPLTDGLMKVLQKTGRDGCNNLLSIKKYCKVFLAERLAGIFHLYGRQVLYLKDKMQPQDQRKCEYYAQLSRFISVQVRKETGVGLLYEYIATSNSIVPRLLQNRSEESQCEKLERLENAYKCSKALLNDPGPMYEEGKYKRVMGTPYTTLNAYKCIVKANCKRLKDQANPFEPTQMSKAECHKLFEIARKNISINMAPNCCIQAMKFFAATGNFDDAFAAFKVGFKTPNPEDSDQVFGISQLMERNPNTYVWAICNYLLAVKAMQKYGNYNGNLVLADLVRKAMDRYDGVTAIKTNDVLTERLKKLGFQ